MDIEKYGANLSNGDLNVASQLARAKAKIESRYIVAMHNKRNLDKFRQDLLKEARRPAMAKKASYRIPFGNKQATGPTIRFAEAALKAFTNLDIEGCITYEDDRQRKLEVTGTDLENNTSISIETSVPKTKERRTVPEGDEPLGVRQNAEGKPVYLLAASERDMIQLTGIAFSKLARNVIMRLVPGDIVDEALDEARRVAATQDAEDPDKARKEIADAFAAIRVTVEMLTNYFETDLDKLSPQQLTVARELYAAIRDGDLTWAQAIELKEDQKKSRSKQTRTDRMKAKAKEHAERDAKAAEEVE